MNTIVTLPILVFEDEDLNEVIQKVMQCVHSTDRAVVIGQDEADALVESLGSEAIH